MEIDVSSLPIAKPEKTYAHFTRKEGRFDYANPGRTSVFYKIYWGPYADAAKEAGATDHLHFDLEDDISHSIDDSEIDVLLEEMTDYYDNNIVIDTNRKGVYAAVEFYKTIEKENKRKRAVYDFLKAAHDLREACNVLDVAGFAAKEALGVSEFNNLKEELTGGSTVCGDCNES